jgi:hypothetical protein
MGRPKTTKLQINGDGKLVTEKICKITSKTTVFNPKRRRKIESEKSNAGKARRAGGRAATADVLG